MVLNWRFVTIKASKHAASVIRIVNIFSYFIAQNLLLIFLHFILLSPAEVKGT